MHTYRLTSAERETMGDRVRAARCVAGLTIRDIGTDLGVTPNSVSQWEHGSLPGAIHRAKLAKLLGFPETKLFAEHHAMITKARALIEAEPSRAS